MKTLHYLKSVLFLTLFFFFCNGNTQNLGNKIDQLVTLNYKANEPGASILVSKKGKIIYKKAFGNANLELNIPMTSDNVFEIGSITKQFTAVSILMLVEQGKILLSDEITRFIPDYPINKKITIHHLLTHTSGIKNYTSMRGFRGIIKKDMSPVDMIDFFKNEPMEFEPGSKYRYNNSAYIILGYIIEKVSGLSYEDFIQKNIFEKINMNSSLYGSHTKLVKNRASGYRNKGTYTNTDYLNFSIPYAGGSIMSTVEDMFKWQQAILTNTLVKKETISKAFVNYKLNNGSYINYGYGWGINDINGEKSVEHGGGILGFTSMGVYIPNKDVYVLVLTNCDCNPPRDLAIKIAALTMGKPYKKLEDKTLLSLKELQQWVGFYQFKDGAIRHISLEGNQLYSQKNGSAKFKIFPSSNNTFYFENSLVQYMFSKNNGRKELIAKNRIQQFKGAQVDTALSAEKETIKIGSKILTQYAGNYSLRPGLSIKITAEGNKIFAEPTGKPKIELYEDSKDSFFLKVVKAKIVFGRDAAGRIINLTLHQGGQKMTGNKTS